MGKRSMVRLGSLAVLLAVVLVEAALPPAGAAGMASLPPGESFQSAARESVGPEAAGPAVGVGPALPPAPAPPFTLTPGLPPAPFLALSVEVQPTWAFPDETVTVTVWARNEGLGLLEGVVLRADWPAGLKVRRPAPGIQTSGESFVWPLPPLAAGTALSTTLRAQATAEALDKGHVLLAVEGGQATPGEAVRATALLVVSDPQEQPTGADIPSASGGRLSTADGRVAVDIPAGAVTAPGDLHFEYRSLGLLRQERPPEELPREWAAAELCLPGASAGVHL